MDRVVVNNVLLEFIILKKLYPSADIDFPDLSLNLAKTKNFKSVKFGNNVLIGKNVKIGKKTIMDQIQLLKAKLKWRELCNWIWMYY